MPPPPKPPRLPRTRLLLVAGLAVLIGVALLVGGSATLGQGPQDRALQAALFAAPGLAVSDPIRALTAGRPWLNGAPLRPEDLRGKVVLVNFWTYSCINSLRPLPYLRVWAAKYKDRGLVVVGVHTPEFAFEKDAANVGLAAAGLGIGYPVVLDSDDAIWRAYGNQAWPAFYFIDAKGRVRRRTLGEGGYDQAEKLIQELLTEAGGQPVRGEIVPIAGHGPQLAPDWPGIRSPETYLGYAKASGFSPLGGLRRNTETRYRLPPGRPALNSWSLSGLWSVGAEYATATGETGAVAYRFHARDLNLVMAPPPGGPVRFRVRIDGADPGPDHGFDIDDQGRGLLDKPRMYQLVRQRTPVSDRTVEIEFLDPGARAYVFTFG